LALQLLDKGAVKFGAFRLKLHDKNPNAPPSPIYVDLRILRSLPDVMDSAVEVYESLANGLKFDLLADVPRAATPIVAILSHKSRVPMVSPRMDEKEHGIRRHIDGLFEHGQRVLVIDDLITLADSKLAAITILEENGLKVTDVLVLIDREQGGVEALSRRGISCHCAFKLKSLLDFYLEEKRITTEQYERTVGYLQNE
jgi:uridine monophosphate synthetase